MSQIIRQHFLLTQDIDKIAKEKLTNLVMLVFLATLTTGTVIREPSINNPCQRDFTGTVAPQYLPLDEQIILTITAANTAHTMCQRLKESLSIVLLPAEITLLETLLDNAPGLSWGHNDTPALTPTNAFTRTMRHSVLNITILDNILEQLLRAGALQTFDQSLRNVLSAILALKCRITTTGDVVESDFTSEESLIDGEMELADNMEFLRLVESISTLPRPKDEKEVVYLAYSVARYLQIFLETLTEYLEAKLQNIEQI